jgi:flavin reductase (DIM6/NTAB) family NADH-FMN oxidoreductase RutF
MKEVPLEQSVRLISPRLTVLVNTLDEKGELNSSPHSWIFPLSFNPPLIGVGIGGKHKHTYMNAKRVGEFVVCVVSEEFGQQAVNCEEPHEPGDRPWARHGLHAARSAKVAVPRIAESKAVLECRVDGFLQPRGDHVILVGEVLHAEAVEGGLEAVRPLLHDSGEKFRAVGREITLKRKR